MANWGAFSDGFTNSFNRSLDKYNKKKQAELEQQFRLAALDHAATLEQNALTPVEKQMQRFGFELSPKGFDQYNQATNPFRLQELKLQQLEQNMKVPYYKALTSSAMQPKSELGQQLTDLMRSGMTKEQALDLIEKLKKSNSFNPFGFGMFGTGNPSTPTELDLNK
ncbi:MAG: hypothetical protein KBD78_03935 [Oligoflexales bacterium]|nr:hypothetical protein [Oligoflexales bacterium]